MKPLQAFEFESSHEETMNIQEHIDRIHRDGWSVVPRVIPAGRIDAIRNQVCQSAAEHGRAKAAKLGIGQVPGFIRYDQSLSPYLSDPKLMVLLEALLGRYLKVSFITATINHPGNPRGRWHADWPFNQNNAGHISAPYPDVIMHLTTLWMLSPFTKDNGGTLIVPGSHRWPSNPTDNIGVDPEAPYPTEMHAVGEAGSVLVLDSRIWHSTASNYSDESRASVVIRYAPWWLNTRVLAPGSEEREMMVEEPGAMENDQPLVPRNVYDDLPKATKRLFRHWVEG